MIRQRIALVFVMSLEISLLGQQPAAPPVKKVPATKGAQPSGPLSPQTVAVPSPSSLTVNSVISLLQAGLSEEIIVARVRKENKSFDLSPEDMIRLKKAGASDSILTVMMDLKAEIKPAAPPQTSATPAVPQTSTAAPAAVEKAPGRPTEPKAAPTSTEQGAPPEERSKNPLRRLPNLPRLRHSGGSSNWKDQLKQEIEGTWTLSKVGVDRIRVTQPGAVLIVKKDGIIGDLSTDATFGKNTVQDGKVTPPKGVMAVLVNKETSHPFKVGERVYLWKVSIDDEDVALFLLSCETFAVNAKGTTKQLRYKALVDFKFAKDHLQATDFSNVKAVIAEVLATEQEYQSGNTKNVSVGQTFQEVESALGKPEKIVNLGVKVIYIYKDMKVVFTEGKVVDVQ